MPNKSDTAGKIHEYYTYLEFKEHYKIAWKSPFDDVKELQTWLFSDNEIRNLKEAWILTFTIIKNFLSNKIPTHILHAWESSWSSTHDNTDDLIITLEDDTKVWFSLKCAKDKGTVLSKNMWAKSLISTYFWSISWQNDFNNFFESQHLIFLNNIFNTSFSNITEAKKFIKWKSKQDWYTKDRFEYYEGSEKCRNDFLIQLPSKLKNIVDSISIEEKIQAWNLILDAWKNIIFATYGNKIDAWYYHYDELKKEDFIDAKIRDNRSMTLIFNKLIIGFRYKFESSITSSIKLVGDYTEV